MPPILKAVRFITTLVLIRFCYLSHHQDFSLDLRIQIFLLIVILATLSALDWIAQSHKLVKAGIKCFALMILVTGLIYRISLHTTESVIGGPASLTMFLSSVLAIILLWSIGLIPKLGRGTVDKMME